MSKRIVALNAKLLALKATFVITERSNQSLSSLAAEIKEDSRLAEAQKAKPSR
jgi:hypothetical protein